MKKSFLAVLTVFCLLNIQIIICSKKVYQIKDFKPFCLFYITFDFLIEKSNFIKILEGAYSGKKTSGIEKMVNNLDLSADIAGLETF